MRVDSEPVLTNMPMKADLLLVKSSHCMPERTRALHKLWPLILVEYKSGGRPPRSGDLVRLATCGRLYHHQRIESVGNASNLGLILIASRMTPTLQREIQRMNLNLQNLGAGYNRTYGGLYPMWLVFLDEVAKSEQNNLLEVFGSGKLKNADITTLNWYSENNMKKTKANPQGTDPDIENDEAREILLNTLAERLTATERYRLFNPEYPRSGLKWSEHLASLKPEERIAGLKPEERIAGMRPEELVAGMSKDDLVRLMRCIPERIRGRRWPEAPSAARGAAERAGGPGSDTFLADSVGNRTESY